MTNPTNIILTTKEEVPSFIKKKHELAGVLKKISEGSKKAVSLLIDTMSDEKVDLKTRLDCAKNLITFETSITEQINRDSMNRLIAEIKVKPGGLTPTLTIEEEKSKLPILDFNTVRSVD